MVPSPGMRVDDLVLVAPLGRGAQGSVWRARSQDGGRVVALKLLQLRGSKDGFRAKREAVALSHLRHPSLPRCTRMIEGLGDDWIALELELVDGTDLGAACAALDLRARRLALLHVARALAHLHHAGLVHRDVKPANIVVAHDFADVPGDAARCKLVDLGIAVRTGNPAPLTMLGHPGTVPFMAPEALIPTVYPYPPGKPTLDVFAFGVTAWRVLRDRHPTGLAPDPMTEDLVTAYADHAGAEHLFLPPDDVSDPFERVLASCLRLRADQRPPDAGAVVAMLEDALHASPRSRPAETLPRTAERTEPASAPPVRPAPVAPTVRDAFVLPSVIVDASAPGRAASPFARPARANGPPPSASGSGPRTASASRSRRSPWVALAITSLLATLATVAMVTIGDRDPDAESSAAIERAIVVPAAPEVPTTRMTADAPEPGADVRRTPIATDPPIAWETIGESNVKHSTVHGCETKVLAGWFRIRCLDRPGEALRVTAPPEAQARVSHDGRATTVLLPLLGRDQILTFDWVGGRGVRTLHVVGHEVEHRVIASQGELSAP